MGEVLAANAGAAGSYGCCHFVELVCVLNVCTLSGSGIATGGWSEIGDDRHVMWVYPVSKLRCLLYGVGLVKRVVFLMMV